MPMIEVARVGARASGWADAVAGCEYVLHVAYRMPQGEPKNEDEVIRPAREGVVRFRRDAKVRRVVVGGCAGRHRREPRALSES